MWVYTENLRVIFLFFSLAKVAWLKVKSHKVTKKVTQIEKSESRVTPNLRKKSKVRVKIRVKKVIWLTLPVPDHVIAKEGNFNNADFPEPEPEIKFSQKPEPEQEPWS